MQNRYAEESASSASALPNRPLFSSVEAGWRALLLEHHSSRGASDVFDVPATSDQTIVVALGSHDLDILRGGRWQSVPMHAGATGTTLPGDSPRLRWRAPADDATFETAHLYIPWSIFAETIDRYLQVGQQARTERLSLLSAGDPVVTLTVAALLQGMRAGAPDLYAQSAREWMAVHMLCVTRTVDAERVERPRMVEPSDRRLRRAIEAMAASLGESLSLQTLATEAGMSRFHFLRTFRAATGRTPTRYLIELRMKAARTLLTTTDLPVADIARRCGYARANNFSEAFARFHGTAPSAVRKGG